MDSRQTARALLAALAGQPIRGTGRIGFEATGNAEAGWTVAIDGGLADVRAEDALIQAVVGRSPSLAGKVTVGPSGAVTARDLRVDLAAAGLTASADLPAGAGRIDLRYRIAVPQLAPIGPAAGTPMAGRLTLSGTLAGKWEALTLRGEIDGAGVSVAGNDLGAPSGRFTLANLADAPTGPIELRLRPLGRPVTLSASLRATPAEVRLDDIAAVAEEGRLAVGHGRPISPL